MKDREVCLRQAWEAVGTSHFGKCEGTSVVCPLVVYLFLQSVQHQVERE